MERRQESYLKDYWPNRSLTGAPKYWAQTSQGTFLVAPTPDAAYTVELSYTYRPAALSATNTTTWLSTWCPDLLLYAALQFAGAYIKDYQQMQAWEAQYQMALKTALVEEARRKAAGYTDYGPSRPPSNPTL
jgi:hypothetical protein